MSKLHTVAFVLVIVGALNWLLTAFDWNLVNKILGSWSMVEKAVYILVGLSGVYLIVTHKKTCKCCEVSPSATPQL